MALGVQGTEEGNWSRRSSTAARNFSPRHLLLGGHARAADHPHHCPCLMDDIILIVQDERVPKAGGEILVGCPDSECRSQQRRWGGQHGNRAGQIFMALLFECRAAVVPVVLHKMRRDSGSRILRHSSMLDARLCFGGNQAELRLQGGQVRAR